MYALRDETVSHRPSLHRLPESRFLAEVPLERTGQVFTFTRDHLYVAADSPTIMAVVDVNQGGRLYIQMTDVDPEDVRIGDDVVLTLRRRKEGPTMHHYYWKCRPAR